MGKEKTEFGAISEVLIGRKIKSVRKLTESECEILDVGINSICIDVGTLTQKIEIIITTGSLQVYTEGNLVGDNLLKFPLG